MLERSCLDIKELESENNYKSIKKKKIKQIQWYS